MRVLFLDFDGVLNCSAWLKSIKDQLTPETQHLILDPEMVARVNEIVTETEAKVVLSTSWRSDGLDYCRGMLERRGFVGEVIDRTGEGPVVERGRQIREWLDAHPEVEAFAVLDDDHLSTFDDDVVDDVVVQHHVRTSWWIGIRPEHVKKAIEILLKNEPA